MCLLLGGLHSPGPEDLWQGTPAPAAIALRADLVSGGHAVLVFVCELVDLVSQFLHCAGPKAASSAAGALVHALAVAFDSNVGCALSAGLWGARRALLVLEPKCLGRDCLLINEPGRVAAGRL